MLYFHGFGHFHPENVIDNAFLEALDIGTTEQWIKDRVGIESRRTVLPLDYVRSTKNQDLRAAQEARLYTNAETSKRAAMMAIERAGIKPSDIGMVFGGTSSPDYCIPTEASAVAKELGLEVPAIDISCACSSFGAHCHFADQMGASLPDYVLFVVPENTTRVTNFADRSSAILFGDATAAAVVSTKIPSKVRGTFTRYGSSPAGALDVVIPRVGHFTQNGSAVQKFAIKRMTELLREIQGRATDAKRVVYVGHQANLTMLNSVAGRCDIAPENHFHNIIEFGNQAAAGAPAVISQRWNDFRPGDVAAFVVVGSGLSWSSVQIEFT
jgi:3-oxoacyl-[acyl-carrier-protein] synthase-3